MAPSDDDSIDRFLERYNALVPGQSSPLWTEMRTHVPAAIEAGEWRWIAALYDRIAVDCPPLLHLVRSDALTALAFVRDRAALDAFVARARVAPSWAKGFDRTARGWPRKVGAMLGYQQDTAALEYLIETYGDAGDVVESLLCFAQELVSFDLPVADSAIVRRFWRRHGEVGHALAGLPLSLLECEKGLRRRYPGPLDLLGNWFWFSHTFSTYASDPPPSLPRASVDRELALDDVARTEAAGAFADPMSFPNGRFEARAFSIEPSDGPRSVRGLPLECLEGDPEPLVELAKSHVETLSALWSMFTQGGAYAEGRSAAYGRLHAWRTLASLAGVDASTELRAVDDAARRSWFTMFSSASASWFDHVCIDVGITCVRSDGRSMMALAATDSD
ncbi:MAG: hypothetical protein JNK05_38545 [Myxococcales bacterium]|nr:hypothetical protein [Myxococcales bacterium]